MQNHIYMYHHCSRTLSYKETEINNKRPSIVNPGAHEKGCSTSAFTQLDRCMQQKGHTWSQFQPDLGIN